MKQAKRIQVTGKLHGTGYRFAAMQKAYDLGISGTVAYHGHAILIEAEGDEAALEKFVQWGRKGPYGCRVDSLMVEDGELKNFTGFEKL